MKKEVALEITGWNGIKIRIYKGVKYNFNSTIKSKPKKIKLISAKSKNLWEKAKQECFKKFGKRCFLCHCTENIEVHHWQETRSRNPSRKYDPNNLVPLCHHCHNHKGNDTNFEKLKERITMIMTLKGKKND
jgi:hypothetical protein